MLGSIPVWFANVSNTSPVARRRAWIVLFVAQRDSGSVTGNDALWCSRYFWIATRRSSSKKLVIIVK